MTDMEEAKAAAEAAVQEHFALRKEQTERVRKAKAGGVKGELLSPPPPSLPPFRPNSHPTPPFLPPAPNKEQSQVLVLPKEEEEGGAGEGVRGRRYVMQG